MLKDPLRHMVADNPFDIIPRYHPANNFFVYFLRIMKTANSDENNVHSFSFALIVKSPSSSAICLAIATVEGASEAWDVFDCAFT